ncbi:hypothetical protein LCGC14_3048130 [marine sediment metagenome]|uniref:Uncharacterized protein n=1 Tax=marine sediment metagenome TaxID=412755 RepID=A0A0F8WMG0_9ZZZZ
MEIAEFIFGNFWRWLGAFFILGGICNGLGNILPRVIGRRIAKKINDKKGCSMKFNGED